jgi:isoleucyl-tRNA synthetase
MARVYKIALYVVDYNDDYKTADEFIAEQLDNTGCLINAVEEKTSKQFKWRDDHPLNFNNAPLEAYEKMFPAIAQGRDAHGA